MGIYDLPETSLRSRISRLEDAIPYQLSRGIYAGNINRTFSAVTADTVSNGMIDLASGGILTVGSIPPSVTENAFAFTATTTTETIYWDGTNGSLVPVVRRADGTKSTVPPSNLTVTGLTANTWYGYLPFWNPLNQCTIGWAQGTAGTPQIAFPGGTGTAFTFAGTGSAQADALAMQLLQGREQLSSGFVTFKTPAAGTSSGGGSYDGGTSCVMLQTDIETLGDLPYSSELKPQSEWRRLILRSGRSLNCTPNHPLYDPERKVRADELKAGDWVITINGEEKIAEAENFMRLCTKVKVKMPVGHLFWANTFLSHNAKL